jgi:hypothetical protein
MEIVAVRDCLMVFFEDLYVVKSATVWINRLYFLSIRAANKLLYPIRITLDVHCQRQKSFPTILWAKIVTGEHKISREMCLAFLSDL